MDSLFPSLINKETDFDGWFQHARGRIPEKLNELETDCKQKSEKIEEMEKEIAEKSVLTNDLRDTLTDTVRPVKGPALILYYYYYLVEEIGGSNEEMGRERERL